LSILGNKVELNSFRKFSGKLDCSMNGSTGNYSYYSTFEDRKIMFYVGGYLNPENNILPNQKEISEYVVIYKIVLFSFLISLHSLYS
jgi:hypothetical protein